MRNYIGLYPNVALCFLALSFPNCSEGPTNTTTYAPAAPNWRQEDAAAVRAEIEAFSLDEDKADFLAPGLRDELMDAVRAANAHYDAGEWEQAAAAYAALRKKFDELKSGLETAAWTRTYPRDGADFATHVLAVEDGYLVGGVETRPSAGQKDVYLARINAVGDELWRKTYGGDERESLGAILPLDDGFFLVGETASFKDYSGDVYLVRVDAQGGERWTATFGKPGTDTGVGAVRLDGGACLVVARTYQGGGGMKALLARIEADGAVTWERLIKDEGDLFAAAVIELADGTILIAGTTGRLNENRNRILVMAVSPDGAERWRRTVADAQYARPETVTARAARNGGFTIAAEVRPGPDEQTLWRDRDPKATVLVATLDKEGKTIWMRDIGGRDWDSPAAALPLDDGGALLVATTKSYGSGGEDILFARFDGYGKEQWSRTIGTDRDETAHAAVLAPDGGFLIAGAFRAGQGDAALDAQLIKTDPLGRAWAENAPLSTERIEPVRMASVDSGAANLLLLATRVKVGDEAPEIGAEEWLNINGPISLHSLRGKVVVLEFWATWCGPCRISIPHLVKLNDEYGSKGVVLVSLTDEDRVEAKIDAFMADMKMDYIVGTGSDTHIDYGVNGIPTAFVIDRAGKIAWIGHPMSDLERAIESALTEQ